MRRAAIVFVSWIAACGDDELFAPKDSGIEDASLPLRDAGPEARDAHVATCRDRPFGPLALARELSSPVPDYAVRFFGNEAYVGRETEAGLAPRIFVGPRDGGMFTMMPGPIDDGDVSRVTFAADGLSLLFDTARGDAGNVDLWIATRADASATFDSVQPAGGDVDGPRDDSKPWLAAGGSRLYFSRGTAGSVDTNVFVAGRTADGGFAIQRELTELGSADFQVLTEDELLVVYAQKGRIATARRRSISDPFDTPVITPELGTFTSPTWISPDGCTIFMDKLGPDTLDIFVAQR
jgi:hypothetical protein